MPITCLEEKLWYLSRPDRERTEGCDAAVGLGQIVNYHRAHCDADHLRRLGRRDLFQTDPRGVKDTPLRSVPAHRLSPREWAPLRVKLKDTPEVSAARMSFLTTWVGGCLRLRYRVLSKDDQESKNQFLQNQRFVPAANFYGADQARPFKIFMGMESQH